MLKSKLIDAIQTEIKRHNWDGYMDKTHTPGCSVCRVPINTTTQLLAHIAGAMPALIDRLSAEGK